MEMRRRQQCTAQAWEESGGGGGRGGGFTAGGTTSSTPTQSNESLLRAGQERHRATHAGKAHTGKIMAPRGAGGRG